MSGHYITGRAASANWAWRVAALATAMLPLAVVFFRLRILDLPTLTWSLAASAALVACGLLLAIYALARVWILGERGGGRAVAALVVGVVAAAPFAFAAFLFAGNPPGNVAETAGLAGASAGSPTAGEQAAVLPGRDFQATASSVYAALRTAIANEGMTILDVSTPALPVPGSGDLGVSGTVAVPIPTPRDSVDRDQPYDPLRELDADEYTIRATAFSPLFAFPSDVTVRIVEESGDTFVDVRSVSRTLDNDFGANRRLVRGLLDALDEAMNVLEGLAPAN